MVVAAIPMMILDWGWLQANVAARRTWWALVASSVAMASLGSAPMTLEVASVSFPTLNCVLILTLDLSFSTQLKHEP